MWTKVKLFFGAVGDFLKPVAKLFASKAGNVLKDVALDIVKQIAADPSLIKSGGLAKRQAAFDLIVKDMKKKGFEIGIDIANYAINLAIEAAYTKAVDDGDIKGE